MDSGDSTDYFSRAYGNLLYDLCESVLWNPNQAKDTFRAILKKLSSKVRFEKYSNHERSWVLKVACDKLFQDSQHHAHRVSAEEQIKLDASDHVSTRLKQFASYFHRLTPEDQILLLLRDKYQISYPEISAAMGAPEGSLKMRRQQALRTLEEWLWNNR